MATSTQNRTSNRSSSGRSGSSSEGSNRSGSESASRRRSSSSEGKRAVSWGEGSGPIIGAALAGAAIVHATSNAAGTALDP